ncbi:darcynin family protein [Halothiobacillus neapolitanus]
MNSNVTWEIQMNQHAFTVFVHLKAEISWLALSRPERNELTQAKIFPILQEHPNVHHTHFDAEAFCGFVSDIEMFSCDDPRQFYFFFEKFRDSELISKGYFTIVNIFPAYADGYVEYENRLKA